MKDKIKEKFSGIKHKWIYFHTDTREFQHILDKITVAINEKRYSSKKAISLIKSFKFHEKAFIKFVKTSGRKNFVCVCRKTTPLCFATYKTQSPVFQKIVSRK